MSTVLDTPVRVESFVRGNLRSGVDHMFVFLDADDPEVLAVLREIPQVTPVVTDEGYWRGARPERLNVRQKINANLARVLLAVLAPGAWLFHIDGDERLDVVREELEALGPEVDVVTLRVHEAVSTADGATGLYKRPLAHDELALLSVLGHLGRPRLGRYFRGYDTGKVGVRASLDRTLRTHDALDAEGVPVEGHRDPAFNVLHDESVSREDFVAKWLRFSRTTAAFRPARAKTWAAVQAVVENPVLADQERERLLSEIYDRRIADPVDVLRELGYVAAPDPARHAYAPRTLTDDQRGDLDALLAALLHGRVDVFRPRRSAEQATRLLRAADLLEATRPDLAARVREVLGPPGGAARPLSGPAAAG